MTPDIIHVSQPGKLVGRKVRLGTTVLVDGKPTLKLSRKSVALGNGLELSNELPLISGTVGLAVTAEAARRLGWPHPAIKAPPSPQELARLRSMIGNQDYGENEQEAARVALAELHG